MNRRSCLQWLGLGSLGFFVGCGAKEEEDEEPLPMPPNRFPPRKKKTDKAEKPEKAEQKSGPPPLSRP